MNTTRPTLPYSVADASFATMALASAYAQFLADDRGQEIDVAKYGVIVAHFAPEVGEVV